MSATFTCIPGNNPGELKCNASDMTFATSGFVVLLFAVFCASWAMKSGRSGTGWFFFGLLLAPVAGFVLLWKTAADRDRERATSPDGSTP